MAVTTTKPKTIVIKGKTYDLAELSNNPGNIEVTQGYAGTVGSYANDRDIKHLTPSQLEVIIKDPKKNIPRKFINAEGKEDYKMNAFAIFDHPVMGLRALAVDINSKIKQNLTLEGMVKKYAPKKDNKNQKQYIDAVLNEVAQATGLSIEEVRHKRFKNEANNFIVTKAVMKAKLKFENGGIAFNVDGKYIPADKYYMPHVEKAYALSKDTSLSEHDRYKGPDGLEEKLHETGDLGRTHIDYKYKNNYKIYDPKDNHANAIDSTNPDYDARLDGLGMDERNPLYREEEIV